MSHRLFAGRQAAPAVPAIDSWWALPTDELMRRLGTTPRGLAAAEAAGRLAAVGPNQLGKDQSMSRARIPGSDEIVRRTWAWFVRNVQRDVDSVPARVSSGCCIHDRRFAV